MEGELKEPGSPGADNTNVNVQVGGSETNDFYLLSKDDVESVDGGSSSADDTTNFPFDLTEGSHIVRNPSDCSRSSTSMDEFPAPVDMELMKRKAAEIASSLQKFRSNTKHADITSLSQCYEPPDDLKRHREMSQYVAQKLKEDRLLFEESKKRSEAVVDKVRAVKKIHKNISENAKELRREETTSDETFALRLKIERLEASVSHLQNSIAAKNQIISEKNETIRTLNESIANTYYAHMNSLEQSQEEIQHLKDEHATAIQKIMNSKEEFCNQLQVVRRKYLQIENELKLSEFARCRLVSRNAELRERINLLENRSNELKTNTLRNEVPFVDYDEEKTETLPNSETIPVIDLRPKIECIAMMVSEFHCFLSGNAGSDTEDTNLIRNDHNLLQSIEKLTDQIESTFCTVRNRLNECAEAETKLKNVEKLNEESKNQETKFKKIIATLKAKIQSEVNVNKELTDELSKMRENTKLLEQVSNRDLSSKYQELENVNEQLQCELKDLRNRLSSVQLGTDYIDEVQKLKEALDVKVKECNHLRHVCMRLEDSNDKVENDFVVLQNRDLDGEDNCKRMWDQLHDKSGKPLEDTKSMNEKTLDYENDQLSWQAEAQEQHARLGNQLEISNQRLFEFETIKTEQEMEMEQEISYLRAEMSNLVQQLDEVRDQLANEITSKNNFKEQIQLADNLNSNLLSEICNLKERNHLLEIEKETLEVAWNELKQKTELLNIENEELKDYCQQLKERLSDLECKYASQDEQLEALKVVNNEQMRHTDELKLQILALQKEADRHVEKYENIKAKHESDKLDLETMKRTNEELTFCTRELRQHIAVLQEENSALLENCEQVRKQIAQLEQENSQLMDNVGKQSSLDDVNTTVSELKQQLVLLEEDRQRLMNDCNQYKLKLENIDWYEQKIEELELRIRFLEEEKRELTVTCQQYEATQTSQALQQCFSELEAEKNRLATECEKFKSKYQRLQLYCKANIAKSNSDGSNTEIEIWKRKYNELKITAASTENEVLRLREMVTQLEAINIDERKSAQEREELLRRTQADLEIARINLQQACSQLEQRQSFCDIRELECKQAELKKSESDLALAYSRLQEMQTSIAECVRQVDGLRYNVIELKNENEVLRLKCKDYCNQYTDLHDRVDTVVGQVKVMFDEAILIICHLQTEWLNSNKESSSIPVSNCEELARVLSTLHNVRQELHTIRQQYLMLKDELQCSTENIRAGITKYERLVTEMHSELSLKDNKLAQVERQLHQKDDDFYQYESNVRVFIESERAKYEQYIEELKRSKPVTTDKIVQTDDENFQHIQTSQTVHQPATLVKYFDYFGGKIKKEISGILQPAEQMEDYSNWILPEKDALEYQSRHHQVAPLELELPLNESLQPVDLEHSEFKVSTSSHLSETSNQGNQTTVSEEHKSTQTVPLCQLPISEVLHHLQLLILGKYNDCDGSTNKAIDWSCEELDANNINFVDTAFKFADLFDLVIKYYFSVSADEVVLKRFKDICAVGVADIVQKVVDRDTMEQLVTLMTRLECEYKHLCDAIVFVEDLIGSRHSLPVVRFRNVIQNWPNHGEVEESDIVDRICEEYDIIPTKFTAGELFTTWKENMVKVLESCTSSPSIPATVVVRVESILRALQYKTLKLISDVQEDKNFNPFNFCDQINGISQYIEHTLDVLRGEEEKIPSQSDSYKEEHGHGHDHEQHEYEHHHVHQHQLEHDHNIQYQHELGHSFDDSHEHHDSHEEEHRHNLERDQEDQMNVNNSSMVLELKSMLAESNKKIDCLVRELMEIKNSREYDEVRQLHNKLDETLYQLHLRDVHIVELTRELSQLLTERDSLQLRLSTIIRQNEQLREASILSNVSDDADMTSMDLSQKLQELHQVSYMKDPRIAETSKQYHAAEMQLFNEDQTEPVQQNQNESGTGFTVPSFFKWFTGESANN